MKIRKTVWFLLAAQLAAGTALAADSPKPDQSRASTFSVTIARVIDGDTVDMAAPVFGVTRIRLDGMDTPEIRRAACDKERYLAYEATGYARALLEGKQIKIITTGKKGRYGRLIARIEMDGVDYSRHMIEMGYANRWDAVWRATPKQERWC